MREREGLEAGDGDPKIPKGAEVRERSEYMHGMGTGRHGTMFGFLLILWSSVTDTVRTMHSSFEDAVLPPPPMLPG